MLKYEGGRYFRQKIICATLAGKSVKLSNVRLEEENVGLAGTPPHVLAA
jgi:RNA 3'-terminal phosphate cyclase